MTPLPDPLAAFVQAAGQLAAAAVERGDRAEARRVLEGALRALELGADGAPPLRVVGERGRPMVSSAARQQATEGPMMAARKTKQPAAPARKVGKLSGRARAMFSIDPEQLDALQAEALRRAKERGSFKPDASEVLRDVLAAWMKRR